MRCLCIKARTSIALPFQPDEDLKCVVLEDQNALILNLREDLNALLLSFFKGFLLCNRSVLFVALHTQLVPIYYTASSALLKSNSLYLLIYTQNNLHSIASRHDLQNGALSSDLLIEKYIVSEA